MRWMNWMTKPVKETFLKQAGTLTTEHYEALLMERYLNGQASWVLDVRDHEGTILWRHAVADVDVRRWLDTLCWVFRVANRTLKKTPLEDVRERVESGID